MLRKQKNKQAWKVLGAMFVLQKVFRKSFIIKDDKEVNQDQSKRFKWTESHHSEWIRQQPNPVTQGNPSGQYYNYVS